MADRITRLLAGSGIQAHQASGFDPGYEVDGDAGMVIAVGGDGTVLQAQRLAIPNRTPVLGVSVGRLGFLAEVLPADLESSLERIIDGDYRVEERSLLEVAHYRESEHLGTYNALNDVVLARGCSPSSLYISAKVDDASLAHYVADGIIAATATGSTAYSLAVGGPVLAPELPNILLTTIAAHLNFVQSIVLSSKSTIELSLLRSQEASLSVDGQVNASVEYGDRLVIESGKGSARFVRLQKPNHFYTQLVARLQHNLARAKVTEPDSDDVEEDGGQMLK